MDRGMDINPVAEGRLYEKDHRRMECTIERERLWEIHEPTPSEARKEESILRDRRSERMHAVFYHIISSHPHPLMPTNTYCSTYKPSHLAHGNYRILPNPCPALSQYPQQ